MSLHGNLEHFPIIDIIQLLHGARKSGILRLSSSKGESQLVFHEGDLVSANYLNSRVRIGQVLVSAGAITEAQLHRALDIQNKLGDARKPLVITMLEHDMVDETAAYNGIESLIEMTIVEVLTWKEGQFSLEVARSDAAGGYHFSRTKFPQRILLNAQGILMESLRIFDEKVRDGSMEEILSIAGVSNLDLGVEKPGSSSPAISFTIPNQVVVPSALQQLLDEQRTMIQRSGDQSYRSKDEVKKLIIDEFPTASKDHKKQLFSLLTRDPQSTDSSSTSPSMAVIVITRSALLSTMVRSACFLDDIYAVATDNIATIDINIRLLLCQAIHLFVFIDVHHGDTGQDLVQTCNKLQKYPQASVVLIACSRFWDTLGLQALSTGVRSIIPRPCKECSPVSAVQQALSFCIDFGTYLKTLSTDSSASDDQRFFSCLSKLCNCTTRSEITASVLEFLIKSFERAIVFSVTGSELVAERSFGVKGDKSDGIVSLPNVRLPLDDQEIFENVIKTGQMYYGFYSDSTWPHELYRLIGRPESPEVLLFPFVRGNTVVAFIYADYGSDLATSPSLHYFEALVQFTTAQISVSAYRQKLKSIMDGVKKSDTAIASEGADHSKKKQHGNSMGRTS